MPTTLTAPVKLNPSKTIPVAIRIDEGGVWRVGDTRVTIDSIISRFKQGLAAEEIVFRFPMVSLGDVFSIIAFYLMDRETVEAYLAEQERLSKALREETGLRAKAES